MCGDSVCWRAGAAVGAAGEPPSWRRWAPQMAEWVFATVAARVACGVVVSASPTAFSFPFCWPHFCRLSSLAKGKCGAASGGLGRPPRVSRTQQPAPAAAAGPIGCGGATGTGAGPGDRGLTAAQVVVARSVLHHVAALLDHVFAGRPTAELFAVMIFGPLLMNMVQVGSPPSSSGEWYRVET